MIREEINKNPINNWSMQDKVISFMMIQELHIPDLQFLRRRLMALSSVTVRIPATVLHLI